MKSLIILFFFASFNIYAGTPPLSLGCFVYDNEGYGVDTPLKEGKAHIFLKNITSENMAEDFIIIEHDDGSSDYVGVSAILSQSGKTVLFIPTKMVGKGIDGNSQRKKTKKRLFYIEIDSKYTLECVRL